VEREALKNGTIRDLYYDLIENVPDEGLDGDNVS